ncbi:BnaC06g24090D [Brassica napus]|uniref:BnaC06g24090D protein n=1 Tax=Brassica napus TaxID=3708 RepID=A0A078FDT7_BRANA|nr:BnaC06g24090D [Brassica napus]
MMADAQKKNCPHKIPIKGSYCAPTICLDKCKKQHGTVGSCAEEKGFCNCAYMP